MRTDNVHTVDVELFTVPPLCLECILPALIPPLCFIHKIPTVYTDSHSRFFFSFKCTEKQIPAILNLSKMVTPSLLKSNLKTLGWDQEAWGGRILTFQRRPECSSDSLWSLRCSKIRLSWFCLQHFGPRSNFEHTVRKAGAVSTLFKVKAEKHLWIIQTGTLTLDVKSAFLLPDYAVQHLIDSPSTLCLDPSDAWLYSG